MTPRDQEKLAGTIALLTELLPRDCRGRAAEALGKQTERYLAQLPRLRQEDRGHLIRLVADTVRLVDAMRACPIQASEGGCP